MWTRCGFGGARPWFLCEWCDKRAAVMYRNAADVWACRKCLGLSYQCQRENPADRSLRKAFKAQDKIEPGQSLGNYPDRPKGMHQATFDRLAARADEVERDSWRAAVKHFGLCL